ncbi:MAG: methylated-DNA--[protein]-cysteine S-methyltransferase [Alphaproteobacteria bacterium]|nr:methylated-DNA--[protein]-cysteine S-methyltransferase [Alphaproteobacteria bacterium]MBV9541815.1 methylated-DNA--[protein]-cysteine S-methyltransferase [Alphaproteobacteria bacterium]MBV9905862.1 methylated-DNA--[protein]-cysteine S-methyltransferase [Alphaproteobacteria bacterium]
MPTSPELFLDRVTTPIGTLLLVADANGRLAMLEFEDKPARWRKHFKDGTFAKKSNPGGVSAKLKRYFAGDIGALDAIETTAQGTDFQRACWKNLRKIPAGTTTTYGALAKKVGKPAAMRAVGLANGANPIAIVVPCHRVIGSDGSLTGYGGGLERKRWLLDHERAHV